MYHIGMDFGAVSSQRYFVVVSIFLVLLFTMLEPEALTGTGFMLRLFFWTIQISILIPLLIYVQITIQKFKFFDISNVWIKVTIGGLISSIIFIPIGLSIDYLLNLDDWTNIKNFTDLYPLIIEEMTGVVGPVTLTWIGINAPRILRLNFEIPTIKNEAKKKETDLQTLKTPHILTLIPKDIGDNIIYMASEMHYLRIVTTKGEALELYSLHNAIEELNALCTGIRTHRAFWVNKTHIDKLVGKPPHRNILTSQGYLVPVSRRQYSTVKSFLE